jgi:hypothetical protein
MGTNKGSRYINNLPVVGIWVTPSPKYPFTKISKKWWKKTTITIEGGAP